MTHPLRAHDYLPPSFPESGNVLLTVAEAARELRCSKTHLHNIIHGKVPDLPRLPVLRIGRRVLIRREGLRAWMSSVEENEAKKLTGLHPLKSLL
jgi:excisionase family DNA binding protein